MSQEKKQGGKTLKNDSIASSDNKYVKIKSFSISPPSSKSIEAGSTILAVGLVFAFSLISLNQQNSIIDIEDLGSESDPLQGMYNITLVLIGTIIFNVQYFIGLLIGGWLIGGILAAIIYGKEGSKGPGYGSLILGTIMATIGFISIMVLILSTSTGTDIGQSLGTIIIILAGNFIFLVILSILSIPLWLVAIIGYKIGMFISTT